MVKGCRARGKGMAKPWATSHVATVAAGLGIEHRISGDVKEKLVELLGERLRIITREMEEATLASDPGRKTLDDPVRTRLGFNRTKGLMVDHIRDVDSVGAAAVVAANEQLEAWLRHLLQSAASVATVERVSTVKPRHLEQALAKMGEAAGGFAEDFEAEASQPVSDDLADALGEGNLSGAITPDTIRRMAKSFAGMRIAEDALEELTLDFYDHVGDVQHKMKQGILGGDPQAFISKLNDLQTLFMLGWMRRMLKQAAYNAGVANSKIILLEHIVNLDPWE